MSQIQGRIIDAATGDPMAYVKVSCGSEKVYSNINGIFKLSEKACDSIRLTYVGYQTKKYLLSEDFRQYQMEVQDKSFETLVIKADENLAYRVMEQVVRHKKKNNPLKRPFQYHAYNKFYMTVNLDSAKVFENANDTTMITFYNMMQKQHLFFTESVVNRQRENTVNDKEFVLYERTSGFQNHALSIAASELQSFSIYETHLQIGGVEFLNPVSKTGLSRYDMTMDGFEMAGQDTVFTILFEPKNNSFKGLKGHFKINSNNYGVQYADVRPIGKIATMEIHIKQIYNYLDSLWFPSELNTSISFASNGSNGIVGSGRTVIKDVEIDPDLSETKFNHLKSEKRIDTTIDLDYYRDSLNTKERQTYVVIDSIGRAEKFDTKLKLLESLVKGRLPMGLVDLDLQHLIRFNNVEGFRLGAGLVTSPKLSKHFEIGGYGAYGFKDKQFKYGAQAAVFLNKTYQTTLRASWNRDVHFWGTNTFKLGEDVLLGNELQTFYYDKADLVTAYSVGLESRFARHFKLLLTGEYREHTPYDTLYSFREVLNENVFRLHRDYKVAELSAEVRFVFNEKFVEFFGVQLSDGSDAPQVYFKYRMGVQNMLGQFAYQSMDVLAFHNFKLPFSGQSTVYLKAGWQDRSLPLALSNSLDATFQNWSVSVPFSFETMRVNEFFADRYVTGGLLYNLVRLYKREKSAPELVLAGRLGIGDMHRSSAHEEFEFRTPQKLYAESGIYLNNLYVSDFIGLGLGGLYRLGNYAFPKALDNLAVKFTLNISI